MFLAILKGKYNTVRIYGQQLLVSYFFTILLRDGLGRIIKIRAVKMIPNTTIFDQQFV